MKTLSRSRSTCHMYQNSDRIIIPFIRRGVQDVVTFPLHRNIYIVYVDLHVIRSIACNNINFGDLSFSEIRLNERRHDIEKNLRQRAPAAPACIGAKCHTQRIRPVCAPARFAFISPRGPAVSDFETLIGAQKHSPQNQKPKRT